MPIINNIKMLDTLHGFVIEETASADVLLVFNFQGCKLEMLLDPDEYNIIKEKLK